MYDCDSDLEEFFNDEVALKKKQQDEMRSRRDANRKRLKDGLIRNKKPLPEYNISQGSYAMHTMVNDNKNDYDIDDGVVFLFEDLVNKNGEVMSAFDARKMVRDAIDDGSFQTPPKIKTNCVRVFYSAGYHVDIPVYRTQDYENVQLASSDWTDSNPTEITQWYNQAVIDKSPDTNNGRQMRRITRHLKFFTKSRNSWKNKMPCGFELSVLVDECYVSDIYRDDVSLYESLNAIKNRLKYDYVIKHPINFNIINDGHDDAKAKFLTEKLIDAIEDLDILFDENCRRIDALKAWDKVFENKFWKNRINEEQEKISKQKKKEKIASLLRGGNAGVAVAAGLIPGIGSGETLKSTRAYGCEKNR